MIVQRERYQQGGIYYPAFQEPNSGVTAIAVGIHRISDAKWYDFNGSTWKSSGWTTKHESLAEDDNGLWTLAAGWTTPSLDEVYVIQWKVTDAGGTFYAVGPQLVVGLTYADKYYTTYQEPDTGVTAVTVGIHRVTDGYWYDFNDSTFKASGWTTKHKSLSEDDDGLWLDTTGWTIPPYGESYKVQWKVTDGTGAFYAGGPKLIIDTTGVPTGRDTTLDQTFFCDYTDVHGNKDAGIPALALSIHGDWLNVTIFADPIVVTLSQLGTYPGGVLITASPITVTLSFKAADASTGIGEFLTEAIKSNWVKWSNIGSLDFTIWKDNIAGERPLDWAGWVYAIKKLGNKVIAYGENGVSALLPSGNVYGLNTIYRIGLKGKHAITGDDSVHFFIDNKGQLFKLGESLEMLDYSEYLNAMTSGLVMSWDAENSLVYICDGALGYVYSPKDRSLGAGPVNITGLSSQDGTLYVVSPATISTPAFEIWTDIWDMGTRKGKNIHSLEIATDLSATLQAAIDYRIDKAAAFTRTTWHTIDARGLVFIPCHGRELRFGVKSTTYSYFELDSIIVNGVVNNH